MTTWHYLRPIHAFSLLLCGALLLGAVGGAGAEGTAPPRRVAEVRLRVAEIFSPAELADAHGLMLASRRLINAVHIGTHEAVLRRELLFAAGEPYDERRVRETERNLRALGFLTNVAVVPVDTLPDGDLVLEVRAQETWSLTTAASYAHSPVKDRWSAELSDQNFLGYGVELIASLGADEDRSFRRLSYQNRRVLGSPYQCRFDYTDLSDGRTRNVVFARPYLAEESPWALQAGAWDRTFTPRFYVSPAGAAGTGGERSLYASLPLRERGLQVWAGRRVHRGPGRIWRLGLGLWSDDNRFAVPDAVALSDGRTVGGDVLRAAAGPALTRSSGRRVQPLLVVETLGRRWATERFVMSYGAQEDLNLDPLLRLSAGPALSVLGSDRERFLAEWRVVDWSRLGPGLLLLRHSGQVSLGSRDNRALGVGLEAGWIAHADEVNLSRAWLEGAYGSRLLGPEAFALGLTRGLRTLDYDGMVGDRLVRWNLEQTRLLPGELLGLYKLGVAVFQSGGAAWWHDEARGLGRARHETGVGLRFGPTRSARADVARLDLTWPWSGGGPQVTAVTSGYF
ncbi:MAG: hypothetical protein IPM94_09130 [bacterium]|nr:hypothetical protein [bacterium]